MQHVMPPETYGAEGCTMYESSYGQHQQEVPQTPRRQSGAYTPSREVGYREDYSRAQHASLQGQYQQFHLESPGRPSSEPGVSQEHLRFSAHVNRFASHDPRMTPVHSNGGVGVSVSERIKRFNSSYEDADTRPPPPSSRQYHHQSNHQYGSAPPNAMQHPVLQEQAPRSTPSRQQNRPATRPESSYRRHQEMAQDHYRSPSPDTRQYQRQPQASLARSYSRDTSVEPTSLRRSERRSQSPAQRTPAIAASRSHSRDRIERERRSQSPVPRSSPSRRMSDTQRAARSLLAKRRQRRIEQEEKEQQTPRESEANGDTNATPVSDPVVKKTENRDQGRTDRILREARSRSMSPRTSRYSRKSLATPPPNTDHLNHGITEKQVRITDHRGSTPERYQNSTPTTPGRTKNYQSGSQIAMRQQEPVSPMTPGSPVTPVTNTTQQRMPESPASDQSPMPRNSRVKNSGDTITSGETKSTVSTVQELKRQLWDNNEKLHVAVKPSLHSHGYSDRRTKQTTGYYAPEMAGDQGQRVRSLSPNPKHAVHGRERPASSIEPPSRNSAMFNSKYMQAARVSTREGYSSPEPSEDIRAATSPPHETTDYATKSTPRRSRHQSEDHVQHRTESPLPPIPPRQESSDEDFHSPRAGMSPVPSSATHSIERVPSSAGVSTATGEVSVAKLVAKLSSVSREDPELALQMIDSILRAESKSSAGGPGSRAEIQSVIALASQKETNVVDESAEDDQNDDDESAASSFDDSTSVSSITNPTYQRDDKAHTQIQSTSNSRNPRPSSLNKYSQFRPTSPPEEERGKSSKAKKEKKPPPPATIKVNKSDSDKPNGNKEKPSSKGEKKEKSNASRQKVRGLSPASTDDKRDRHSKPNGTDMDAAAIALKIRGWDDQINNSMEEPPVGMVSLDDTPLSPTRTEDTGRTEDLGSIITPTSQKQIASESPRSHPWDDTHPQSDRKARAIDLSIGTYLNNGFGTDEEMAKAFEPASPWQRRRAAKRETDKKEEIAVSEGGEDTEAYKGNGRDTQSRSRSSTPRSSLSNSRIAPNVYDVHRKRRSRSGSRDRRQDSVSPTVEVNTPSRRNTQQERGNPFDSDYKTTPTSTKSEATNPFDPSYTNTFSSSKSDVGATFESTYKRRTSDSKSDAGNVFDSAWVALPVDAFPGATPESRGRSREKASPAFPDALNINGSPSAANDLPPRTPTNRTPFGKEEAPETSRDHNDSGSKPRLNFLRRRSTTPKRDRTPTQKQNKPLLSAYAMDSVTDVKDVKDEFKVRRSRSRTLSPAPRSVMKSKSPGRNRLKSRNSSFPDDGEDETSSLTGSLTGSTASSVRNKNLAKKFSRFLKVYED